MCLALDEKRRWRLNLKVHINFNFPAMLREWLDYYFFIVFDNWLFYVIQNKITLSVCRLSFFHECKNIIQNFKWLRINKQKVLVIPSLGQVNCFYYCHHIYIDFSLSSRNSLVKPAVKKFPQILRERFSLIKFGINNVLKVETIVF